MITVDLYMRRNLPQEYDHRERPEQKKNKKHAKKTLVYQKTRRYGLGVTLC